MARTVKMPDGTTATYPELQPDGSYDSAFSSGPGWTTGPTAGWNGEIGTGAVHHDWKDNIVPAAVAGIFGYGAVGPGGYAGLGSGGGAGAGAPAAGSGPTASTIANGAKTGMNYSSLFKQMDPSTLILGALSLLGKDPQQQKHLSYGGSGDQLTNPINALHRAMSATYRAGQGLAERPPVQLRAVAPPPPAPISIPGLPFQIGGALGRDPAIADPSLLNVDTSWMNKYNPFQNVGPQDDQNAFAPPQGKK
jgi:hypothetical protein